MKVLDHTDPEWSRRVTRINGALTYSKDLVKYQLPKWEDVLTEDDVISTCPKFSDSSLMGVYNVAVQYLHSYPYYGAVQHVERILWNKKFRCEKLIFVTAYKQFERELEAAGLNAVYVPMAIDTDALTQYKAEKTEENKIIYFGNIVHNKLRVYNHLKRYCQMAGYAVDLISHSLYNGVWTISREEALAKIATYKYGIGVGRCAQELMTLGVKTIVAGQKFGGIITSPEDYKEQLRTNINGRIVTHVDNMQTCIDDIEKSKCYSNNIGSLNHSLIVKDKFML